MHICCFFDLSLSLYIYIYIYTYIREGRGAVGRARRGHDVGVRGAVEPSAVLHGSRLVARGRSPFLQHDYNLTNVRHQTLNKHSISISCSRGAIPMAT